METNIMNIPDIQMPEEMNAINAQARAPRYSFVMEPRASLKLLEAYGGASSISVMVKVYEGTTLKESKTVIPTLTGEAEGFFTTNNRVTADDRGTVIGDVRGIDLTVTGTHTYNGETETCQMLVRIEQKANEILNSFDQNVSFSYPIAEAKGGTAHPEIAATHMAEFTSGSFDYVEMTGYNTHFVKTDDAEWYTLNTSTGDLTVQNNASTETRSHTDGIKLEFTFNDQYLERAATPAQAAGTKVYEEIQISSFTTDMIPASGGTISSGDITYIQPWTWNGVAGSGDTIYSGLNVSYSPALSAPSLGATFRRRTHIGDLSVEVTGLNNKKAQQTAAVYQAENNVMSMNLINISSFSYPEFSAAGGTVSPTMSLACQLVLASGYKFIKNEEYSDEFGFLKFNKKFEIIRNLNNYPTINDIGVLTTPSLGTTEKNRTMVADMKVIVFYHYTILHEDGTKELKAALANSAQTYVYQAANEMILTPLRWVIDGDSRDYFYIPASGGTKRGRILLNLSCTSGVIQEVTTTAIDTTPHDPTFDISGINEHGYITVTARSRGVTLGDTISRTHTIHGSYQGKPVSFPALMIQEENEQLPDELNAECTYPTAPYAGGIINPEIRVSITKCTTSGFWLQDLQVPYDKSFQKHSSDSWYNLISPSTGSVRVNSNTMSGQRVAKEGVGVHITARGISAYITAPIIQSGK